MQYNFCSTFSNMQYIFWTIKKINTISSHFYYVVFLEPIKLHVSDYYKYCLVSF